MGNYFDASRYAEITYSNLRDKKNGMDQESEMFAEGSLNLAHVIYKQKGDLLKAEKLARDALRIRTVLYGSDHHSVGLCCDMLSGILLSQEKLGDETRVLFRRFLDISIINDGRDGLNTAIANTNNGEFYRRLAGIKTTDDAEAQLLLAKNHFAEGLRIYSKIFSPTHPKALQAESQLSIVINQHSYVKLMGKMGRS